MICTKCNSIIPDEAKFCPTCGAVCSSVPTASTTSEEKHTCAKCGLELAANAKFCPVCGTAVSSVSLEKQPDSESLVSSMPSSVDTSVQQPVPAMSAASTVLGEPAPMPQYAPPTGGFIEPSPMPQYAPNGFSTTGNMGAVSTAAAISVPAKKKSGGKIAIIIIAAVVVLLGAAAVFFFTNKAAFLSTFMGKSRYATMIEGNSVKEIAGNIDASAISNGAKALSQFYTTSASKYTGPLVNDILPTSYNPNGVTTTTECMFTSPITDYKSLVETYGKILTETYGVDAIKITANAKINLTDSAISALGNASDVNKVIDAINGTNFTYNLAANDSAMGMYYGAEGKIAVNAKIIMTDDGTCYLAFPFASGKALMFKMDSVSSVRTSNTSTAVLELDEKEITRLIEDVIKIYLEHYEKAVTEMEGGSLTINGDEISGKLITADFSGEAISAMLKDIINHIGTDKYFSTQIIDFINSNGGSITLNQYQSAFSAAASVISVPDSARFSIKTVIDKNGNILAKSYAAGQDNDVEFTYKKGDKNFNAQFIAKDGSDRFIVNMSCVKTDDKSGAVEFSFRENDDEEFRINLSYSGIDTVKSFNTEVPVGTYTISVHMPKGFESIDDEFLTVIDGMQIIVTSSANSDSQTVDLSVKTSAYGDVSLNLTASKSSADEILAIPNDVIDISGVMSGDIDSNTEKKLEDFANEITNALKNIDIFKDYIGEIESIKPEIPNTPTTPNTPSIAPGASHLGDDFTLMTGEMLEDLSDEYDERLTEIIYYTGNNEVLFNDPTLDNMLSKAIDQYSVVFDCVMDYIVNGDNMSEEKIAEWQDALKILVMNVEECENYIGVNA